VAASKRAGSYRARKSRCACVQLVVIAYQPDSPNQAPRLMPPALQRLPQPRAHIQVGHAHEVPCGDRDVWGSRRRRSAVAAELIDDAAASGLIPGPVLASGVGREKPSCGIAPGAQRDLASRFNCLPQRPLLGMQVRLFARPGGEVPDAACNAGR
jgi:hypothetical protein